MMRRLASIGMMINDTRGSLSLIRRPRKHRTIWGTERIGARKTPFDGRWNEVTERQKDHKQKGVIKNTRAV